MVGSDLSFFLAHPKFVPPVCLERQFGRTILASALRDDRLPPRSHFFLASRSESKGTIFLHTAQSPPLGGPPCSLSDGLVAVLAPLLPYPPSSFSYSADSVRRCVQTILCTEAHARSDFPPRSQLSFFAPGLFTLFFFDVSFRSSLTFAAVFSPGDSGSGLISSRERSLNFSYLCLGYVQRLYPGVETLPAACFDL